MKKLCRRLAAGLLCGAVSLPLLSGCTPGTGSLDNTREAGMETTAVTMWHYYNGAQLQSLEALVAEFNETVGAEQGIIVDAHSYGKVGELTEKVLEAIHKEVGAEDVPDIFAAYADTAYEINQLGMVANLSQYLTEEEQTAYVSGYLDEGRFDSDGFQIFPVAKSTELLSLNKTEWDRFSAATGAQERALSTWEGVADLSKRYYEWTDSLTSDIPDDGRAFFGRDAFANYIIIGSYQLGAELFQAENGSVTLHIDPDIMRRLWDNYYVPYISGYYGDFGNFRSDDLRTGVIAAYVGSTSAATFFPTNVTSADGGETPIEGAVYPLPNFAGTKPVAVQQGAGMVVSKSNPETEQAAVTFLKWLTQPEQNVRFAVSSGYMPVTYAANTVDAIDDALSLSDEVSPVLRDSLRVGVTMTEDYTFYTNRPFEHGYSARQVCDTSLIDYTRQARAQVLALMSQGLSHTEAVARLNTDAQFDQWFATFRDALEDAVAGN